MNVLYVVFRAVLGGHVLSASAIARAMRDHGVQPLFAGGSGPLREQIQKTMPFTEVEIPVLHGSHPTYFTWGSLSAIRRLRQIIRTDRIELIHAFDAHSYMHAYPAGLLERVPVLCTLCGGIDPFYDLPRASSLLVFSEEQKQKMAVGYRWPSECVHVVRTRLDVKSILAEEGGRTDQETANYELDPVCLKIMMISRTDDMKVGSVFSVLDAVEVLFERGQAFQFVLVGGAGNREADVRRRVDGLCTRYGARRVVITGPVLGAHRFLRRATLVLGAGRSAFEGMIYGKPVLVVGEHGYAGTVASDTVERLGFFNFSGRNRTADAPPGSLADEVARLLADPDERERLGQFGRDFVMREIDVEQGAVRIADIYRRLMNPAGCLPRWRQWVSFVSCLAPITRDNAWESAKQIARKATHGTSP